MKLTTKGQYAIQAMIAVALHSTNSKRPISLKEIATSDNIPFAFLEQIAIKLRKANLLKSSRGASGGYVLAKDKKDISLADIMQAVEGPINVTPNTKVKFEVTHKLWEKLNQNIHTILKSITLEDLYFDAISYKAAKDDQYYIQ